jgi:PIN domain nuclease of toxin-antitoxin system
MHVLDTHVLYWWVNRTPDKLSLHQLDAIATADSLAVSAMTCWEMTWLVAHGRIVLGIPVAKWLDQVEQSGVQILSVTRAIAEQSVNLPEHHKDPADRIIIATAIVHDAFLLSVDARFTDYEVLDGRLIAR